MAAPFIRSAPGIDASAILASSNDEQADDKYYPWDAVKALQELADEYYEAQSLEYDLVGLAVTKHVAQLSSLTGNVYQPIHPNADLALPHSEAVLAYANLETGHGISTLPEETAELWGQRFGHQRTMEPGSVLELRVDTKDGTQPARDYAYLATLVYPGSGYSHFAVPVVTAERWAQRVSLLLAEYMRQENRLGDVVVASPIWVERRYYQPPPGWMTEEVEKAHARARITAVTAWQRRQPALAGGE